MAIARQIFGPPGTGKTHFLTNGVAAEARARGSDKVLVSSFSNTAAAEVASRATMLPRRNIGTLHSFARRAVGGDYGVALDPEHLADWNSSARPDWRITPDSRRQHSAQEGGAAPGTHSGDALISALDKLRSTFTDPADWPFDVVQFHRAWEPWKNANTLLDFTDMIELAEVRAQEGEPAPGRPEILIIDEAQDNTPLEVSLYLAWGQQADALILALDDDQAINEWRGGDPRRLLALGEADGYEVDRRVLDRSYRIPRAVHAVAERWVRRIKVRQEKVYKPRTTTGDDTGEVVEGAAYAVQHNLNDATLIQEIEREVESGRTVMVLASCAYMLESLIKNLKDSGIPFHNPYRPTEGRWNPLGSGNGMSTAERVYRYMLPAEELGEAGRLWTGEDLRAWLPLVKVDAAGLRRGAKTEVENLASDTISWETVAALWADPRQREQAVEPSLDWLARSLMPSMEKRAAYPLHVARQRGVAALAEEPRVVVGTIHSFKGAAADVVYLAPDLSSAGAAQIESGPEGRDQAIRLFYVAMTRAREELRVLSPSQRKYVRPRDLIPHDLEVLP